MGKVYDVIVLGAGPGGCLPGFMQDAQDFPLRLLRRLLMAVRLRSRMKLKTIRDRKWKAKAGRL